MNFSFNGLKLNFNDKKITKIAVKENHLSDLIQWNESNGKYSIIQDFNELNVLRNILSLIYEDLSQASKIYKISKSTINEDIVNKALELNPIISRTYLLEEVLTNTFNILEKNKKNYNYDSIDILINFVHSLMNMKFSDYQIERFRRIAEGQFNSTSGQTEYNMSELGNFMANTLYSHNDDSMGTLTAIREALQNAVDAVKQNKEKIKDNFKPTVEIKTYAHETNNEHYLDIAIIDNGVGMDLKTLQTSFYQVLNSGKKDQTGATGGFGLAKQKIFSTGRDGWSIDTNGIHSSDFHRNIFYGNNEEYQTNTQSIPSKVVQNGSVLVMYRTPYVHSYMIQDLCQKFGNNSLIIKFNGKVQKPLFDINDLVSFDKGVNGILSEISDDDSRQLMISTMNRNEKEKRKLEQAIGGINLEHNNGFVKVDFYVKKHPYSGNLICLLNGQFQFEKGEYIPKCHIIVNITTNIRPNTPNYPVAPSRDNFEGNLENKISSIVENIKSALREIGEDDLMKEGIDIVNFNGELDAINILSEESENEKARDFSERVINIEQMMDVGIGFEHKNKEERESIVLEKVEEISIKLKGNSELTKEQKEIGQSALNAMIQDIGKYGGKDDFIRDVNKVMKNIFSPVDIVIQKGFISRDVVAERPELTADIALLWKEVLEIAIDYSRISFRKIDRSLFYDKPRFVPGVMFSKEALGLYIPPRKGKGKTHSTIAINAMSIIPLVCKTEVEKKLLPLVIEGRDLPEKEKMRILNDLSIGSNNETPITNVTNYLRHLAAHEVTHYLFSDHGNRYDEYHRYQTDLELIMDSALPEIREKVKAHMPSLRRSLKLLITAIVSDIKRRNKVAKKNERWIKI